MRYRILVLMVLLLLNPLSAIQADTVFVGRVAHLEGRIFFQSGRSLEWMEGYVNSPVQEGDRLWTDLSSYAEIQLDGSLLLRLGSDTKLDIVRMNAAETSIRVWLGSAAIRCMVDIPRERPVIMSSPDGMLNIVAGGSYRIDSMQDNSSRFVVYDGVANLVAGGVSQTLRSGEYSVITPASGGPPQIFRLSGGSDEFERYCSTRDRALTRPSSSAHVPPSVTVGLYDLDMYGVWIYDPHYGYVWQPQVYAGWVPYRYGRWMWVAPWGWTWISYEPWGWAPYHYGTWHFAGGNWYWIPGSYYGPAWVAWSAHSSGVSWVALHPSDIPPGGHHWHAHSSWSANINNPRNSHLPGGGSGSMFLGREDFESGRLIKSDADIKAVPAEVSSGSSWQPMPPQSLKPSRLSTHRESGPSTLPGRSIGSRTPESLPDGRSGSPTDRTAPTPTDRPSTERDPRASQSERYQESSPDRTSTEDSRLPGSTSDRYQDRSPGERPTQSRDETKPEEPVRDANGRSSTSTYQPPPYSSDDRDAKPSTQPVAKPTPKPTVKPAAKPTPKPTAKPDEKSSELKGRQ